MTGYKGRVGLYEIMSVTDALRAQVSEHPDPRKIRATAIQGGLRPLRLAGAQKIAQGETTFEEVVRNAPPIEH